MIDRLDGFRSRRTKVSRESFAGRATRIWVNLSGTHFHAERAQNVVDRRRTPNLQ